MYISFDRFEQLVRTDCSSCTPVAFFWKYLFSALTGPIWMSRHVFNMYAPRSRDCEGRYTTEIAGRIPKCAKRSDFFRISRIRDTDRPTSSGFWRSIWVRGVGLPSVSLLLRIPWHYYIIFTTTVCIVIQPLLMNLVSFFLCWDDPCPQMDLLKPLLGAERTIDALGHYYERSKQTGGSAGVCWVGTNWLF